MLSSEQKDVPQSKLKLSRHKAIIDAVKNYDPEKLKQLAVTEKEALNVTDEKGVPLIRLALEKDYNVEVLKIIIAALDNVKNTYVFSRDIFPGNWSPVTYAAYLNKPRYLKILLKAGWPAVQDSYVQAAKYNHIDCFLTLHQICNNNDFYLKALAYVVIANYPGIVRSLVERNIIIFDIRIRNSGNKRLIDLACNQIYDLLNKQRDQINSEDREIEEQRAELLNAVRAEENIIEALKKLIQLYDKKLYYAERLEAPALKNELIQKLCLQIPLMEKEALQAIVEVDRLVIWLQEYWLEKIKSAAKINDKLKLIIEVCKSSNWSILFKNNEVFISILKNSEFELEVRQILNTDSQKLETQEARTGFLDTVCLIHSAYSEMSEEKNSKLEAKQNTVIQVSIFRHAEAVMTQMRVETYQDTVSESIAAWQAVQEDKPATLKILLKDFDLTAINPAEREEKTAEENKSEAALEAATDQLKKAKTDADIVSAKKAVDEAKQNREKVRKKIRPEETLIHFAIRLGHVRCLEIILEHLKAKIAVIEKLSDEEIWKKYPSAKGIEKLTATQIMEKFPGDDRKPDEIKNAMSPRKLKDTLIKNLTSVIFAKIRIVQAAENKSTVVRKTPAEAAFENIHKPGGNFSPAHLECFLKLRVFPASDEHCSGMFFEKLNDFKNPANELCLRKFIETLSNPYQGDDYPDFRVTVSIAKPIVKIFTPADPAYDFLIDAAPGFRPKMDALKAAKTGDSFKLSIALCKLTKEKFNQISAVLCRFVVESGSDECMKILMENVNDPFPVLSNLKEKMNMKMFEQWERYDDYVHYLDERGSKNIYADLLNGKFFFESKEHGKEFLDYFASSNEAAVKARAALFKTLRFVNGEAEDKINFIIQAGKNYELVCLVLETIYKDDGAAAIVEQAKSAKKYVEERERQENECKDFLNYPNCFISQEAKLSPELADNEQLLELIYKHIFKHKEKEKLLDLICNDKDFPLAKLFADPRAKKQYQKIKDADEKIKKAKALEQKKQQETEAEKARIAALKKAIDENKPEELHVKPEDLLSVRIENSPLLHYAVDRNSHRCLAILIQLAESSDNSKIRATLFEHDVFIAGVNPVEKAFHDNVPACFFEFAIKSDTRTLCRDLVNGSLNSKKIEPCIKALLRQGYLIAELRKVGMGDYQMEDYIYLSFKGDKYPLGRVYYDSNPNDVCKFLINQSLDVQNAIKEKQQKVQEAAEQELKTMLSREISVIYKEIIAGKFHKDVLRKFQQQAQFKDQLFAYLKEIKIEGMYASLGAEVNEKQIDIISKRLELIFEGDERLGRIQLISDALKQHKQVLAYKAEVKSPNPEFVRKLLKGEFSKEQLAFFAAAEFEGKQFAIVLGRYLKDELKLLDAANLHKFVRENELKIENVIVNLDAIFNSSGENEKWDKISKALADQVKKLQVEEAKKAELEKLQAEAYRKQLANEQQGEAKSQQCANLKSPKSVEEFLKLSMDDALLHFKAGVVSIEIQRKLRANVNFTTTLCKHIMLKHTPDKFMAKESLDLVNQMKNHFIFLDDGVDELVKISNNKIRQTLSDLAEKIAARIRNQAPVRTLFSPKPVAAQNAAQQTQSPARMTRRPSKDENAGL